MPMRYPFSVDYMVRLIARHRSWTAVGSLALAVSCGFRRTGAVAVLFCLCVELFIAYNYASKLPRAPLAPLGETDVALVTGGLGGLGLEIVKSLLRHYRLRQVFILDVVEPREDLGDAVQYVKCDLASSQEVDRALSEAHDQCEKNRQVLSVLVNNAGIRVSSPLLAMEKTAIQKVFDINTFAPVSILQRVISRHIENHSSRRLSIVTISSVLGAFGAKYVLAYSASKAAATQFHEVLTQELKSFDSIRILLVTPGQLTTEMFKDLEPHRPFVAPLVDHVALAKAILEKVNVGEIGTMCEPFYANFGYFMKVLPWSMQLQARRFTRMDDSIKCQRK